MIGRNLLRIVQNGEDNYTSTYKKEKRNCNEYRSSKERTARTGKKLHLQTPHSVVRSVVEIAALVLVCTVTAKVYSKTLVTADVA